MCVCVRAYVILLHTVHTYARYAQSTINFIDGGNIDTLQTIRQNFIIQNIPLAAVCIQGQSNLSKFYQSSVTKIFPLKISHHKVVLLLSPHSWQIKPSIFKQWQL